MVQHTNLPLRRILTAMCTIICLICSVGCSDDFKGMLPGEVRLKEKEYIGDDDVQSITVTLADETQQHISALEIRTIWHSIVIKAEDLFTRSDPQTNNTYESPTQAESAFLECVRQSSELFVQTYADTQHAILQELVRAKVRADIKYVWCDQPGEYVTLSFEVSPIVTE